MIGLVSMVGLVAFTLSRAATIPGRRDAARAHDGHCMVVLRVGLGGRFGALMLFKMVMDVQAISKPIRCQIHLMTPNPVTHRHRNLYSI